MASCVFENIVIRCAAYANFSRASAVVVGGLRRIACSRAIEVGSDFTVNFGASAKKRRLRM